MLVVRELNKKTCNLHGGIIGVGEDAWIAAMRELREETTLDIITNVPEPHACALLH